MLKKIGNKREKQSVLFYFIMISLLFHYLFFQYAIDTDEKEVDDFVEITLLSDQTDRAKSQSIKSAIKPKPSVKKQQATKVKKTVKKIIEKPTLVFKTDSRKKNIIVPQTTTSNANPLTSVTIKKRKEPLAVEKNTLLAPQKKKTTILDIHNRSAVSQNAHVIKTDIANQLYQNQHHQEKNKEEKQEGEHLKIDIKNRKLVYLPPKEKIILQKSTPVSFRFQVRANGSVFNILPLKKGNDRLEQISMEYLSKLRFEKIAKNVIQNGIIEFNVNREFI